MSQTSPLPDSVREAQAALRAGKMEPASLHQALQKKWDVQERPFTSDVPVVGPLIVALRRAWNNVATRWYILPLRQQQNEFNSLVVQQLNHFYEQTANHAARLADLSEWLVAQDHDAATQARQLAEIKTRLVQLQSALTELQVVMDRPAHERAAQEAGDD